MASTTVARAATARPTRKVPFPIELYRSAVGKKYVMAITGIGLMGFVFFHMLGNLKMYLGPEDFNHYARVAPRAPRAVPAPHGHPVAAADRADRGLRAPHPRGLQPHPDEPGGPARRSYQGRRDYVAANYASRTMRWSGVIVGLFLVWHLFDLSWTGTGHTFVRGAAYENVDASLSRIPVAILYIVANIALGFHLFHGGVEPLPEHGVEQPALQPLAPRLRRGLRRDHRRRATSRSRSPCWPAW